MKVQLKMYLNLIRYTCKFQFLYTSKCYSINQWWSRNIPKCSYLILKFYNPMEMAATGNIAGSFNIWYAFADCVFMAL